MSRIKILQGPARYAEFEVNRTITFGRELDNIVHLPDNEVSRRHATLEAKGKACILRDLGSRNGTFVNGKTIEEQVLKDGDHIVIGSTSIMFIDETDTSIKEVSPEAPTPAVPPAALQEEVEAVLDASQKTVFFTQRVQEGDPEGLKKANEKLQAVYEVNQAIGAILDLDTLLERVLELIFPHIKADRAFIMLADEMTGDPITQLSRTRAGASEEGIDYSMTIVNRAMTEQLSILSSDAAGDERFASGASVIQAGIRSVMCVPLVSNERSHGVIQVDTTSISNAFGEDDLQLLTAIAGPVAIAVENAKLYDAQKALFNDTIFCLAAAIDARDPYTHGHSHRVSQFSHAIAEELGLSEENLELVRISAMLHDVGKIGVPDAILQKPASLTDEEFDILKTHATLGGQIMEKGSRVQHLIPGITEHHERIDGRGYNKGLKGDDISLLGRIIAIADAFDAMTSSRPYRKRLSDEEALKRLKESVGAQHDEELLKYFFQAYEKGTIISSAE